MILESGIQPKFEELAEDYNIQDYAVESLSADQVRKHFADIVEKYALTQIGTEKIPNATGVKTSSRYSFGWCSTTPPQ